MVGVGCARSLRPLPQRRNFHVRTGAGGGDAHGPERGGGKKIGIGEVCDVRGCVRRPQRGRGLRGYDFFLRRKLHCGAISGALFSLLSPYHDVVEERALTTAAPCSHRWNSKNSTKKSNYSSWKHFRRHRCCRLKSAKKNLPKSWKSAMRNSLRRRSRTIRKSTIPSLARHPNMHRSCGRRHCRKPRRLCGQRNRRGGRG